MKRVIGHFHGDDFWLQLPQLISFLLSYLKLLTLVRFKKHYPLFAPESNKVKDSGSCIEVDHCIKVLSNLVYNVNIDC